MMLNEALAKAIRGCYRLADPVYGEDAVLLPLFGPSTLNSHTPPSNWRGLRIDVSLGAVYSVWCKDQATVRACHALRQADGGLADALDFKALLDVFGVTWCSDNEFLQVQGLQTLPAAAAAAWRLGEAAIAIQAVAYAITDWQP